MTLEVHLVFTSGEPSAASAGIPARASNSFLMLNRKDRQEPVPQSPGVSGSHGGRWCPPADYP